MRRISNNFLGRDFWLEESRRYSEVHFRLEKCARILNTLSRGKSCDLLDVGCGPATLAKRLHKNINYFGIDMAIHNPAPNLLEMDITENEIKFENKTFDLIVMQGVVEYLGDFQCKKFAEIKLILKCNGKFIVTYEKFSHWKSELFDKHSIYNNMQPIEDLKNDLGSFFQIEKFFTSSHNWYRSEPRRKWLYKVQMPLRIHIPIISRLLAVEYFFVCSLKQGIG